MTNILIPLPKIEFIVLTIPALEDCSVLVLGVYRLFMCLYHISSFIFLLFRIASCIFIRLHISLFVYSQAFADFLKASTFVNSIFFLSSSFILRISALYN